MLYNSLISWIVACLFLTGTLGKKIIVDTDLFSDVDDAAALLLASDLLDPSDLLAVNINYPSAYSALAASSILGNYKRPHVPIGLRRPISWDAYFDDMRYENGEYASKVAYHWRNTSALPWEESSTSTWDPVELYRKVLANQKNESVTIASIGFLDNLSGLLNSTADCYSQLSGFELVKAKVSELAIMGGEYPLGREFNFYGENPAIAAHVVDTWPSTMTFLGFEAGENVLSGVPLMEKGPGNDPVKAAYQWYNGYGNARPSWDPLTTLYAIQGLGDLFAYGDSSGHNHIYKNGSNAWSSKEPKGNPQRWLKLAVSDESAGEALDRLYLDGAKRLAG